MPETEDFSACVLVGGQALPEYTVNGATYIECILTSEVSYKLLQTDYVSGEVEQQEFPVTPYRIQISAKKDSSSSAAKYFRVLVDGVKVKAVSLKPSEQRVLKGFRDGTVLREFLFSLPRPPKHKSDRIEVSRESSIGEITIECWEARLKASDWVVRAQELDFIQACKNDCDQVTNGSHTMTTTKIGKAISKRSIMRKLDKWDRIKICSSVVLKYRMGHTLQEMGVTLQPLRGTVMQKDQKPIKKEEKENGNLLKWNNDVIEIDDDDSEDDAGPSGSSSSSRQSTEPNRTAVIDLRDSDSDSDVQFVDRSKRRSKCQISPRKRQKKSSVAVAESGGAPVCNTTLVEETDLSDNAIASRKVNVSAVSRDEDSEVPVKSTEIVNNQVSEGTPCNEESNLPSPNERSPETSGNAADLDENELPKQSSTSPIVSNDTSAAVDDGTNEIPPLGVAERSTTNDASSAKPVDIVKEILLDIISSDLDPPEAPQSAIDDHPEATETVDTTPHL